VNAAKNHRQSEFAAPWSRLLKGVSAGATVILLGVAVVVCFTVPSGTPWVRPLVLASTPFILAACALFTVRGYRIAGRTLLVKRLFWWTPISLEGLRDALVDPEAMRKAVRICGNGGMFSFSGWFWNKRLGRFRAYATDLRRTIVLTFPDRRIVLSPDQPDAFVAALTRDRQLRG
jgi:hypothetical protein